MKCYSEHTVYTGCANKTTPLMFDNNVGKCGPIFKIQLPIDSYKKNLYACTTNISASPATCCYTTL